MITKPETALIKAMVALTVLLLVAQFFQQSLVFNREAINAQEWWRLLSGNFTHANFPHLALNVAGLWVLLFLFSHTFNHTVFVISIIMLCFIVGISLYLFNPQLVFYYGFSGVLYGLFIIGSAQALLKKDGFTGISVLFVTLGKVIWDSINGGSETSADLIGMPVATDAHLYGVIGGIFISLVLVLYQHFYKVHPP